jgi:hypothetical protein
MARLRNGLVAFSAVGGLAALSVLGDEIGAVVFFWVLFGGIAGVVAMLATRGRVERDLDEGVVFPKRRSLFPDEFEEPVPELRDGNPFVDDNGVVRYPGDHSDIENFPTPGACGRF